MKKGLSLFLSLIMVLGILTSMPLTAGAASVDDLKFEFNDDGESYSVVGCDTSVEGEIVIPDTYEGLPVTSIGDYAFQYCVNLTSIAIPDSITNIGFSVFFECASLVSVYINDIASWCNIVFSDSESNPLCYADNLYINGALITDIVIPCDVTSIGNWSFAGCNSLNSVIIENGVANIGDYAFYDCNNLASFEMPNSIINIGKYAFYSCDNLSSIQIPDSVVSIGSAAFEDCKSLITITIPDSVTSLGSWAFAWCDRLSSAIIGNSVTGIEAQTFRNCNSLNNVTLGNKVANIGYGAFINCTNLSSITLPDDLTNIDIEAFANCALISIVIPNNVKSIGQCAFQYCENLSAVTIGNSVTNIGNNAFENCTSLKSIIIPDNVMSIGEQAIGYYWDENIDDLGKREDLIIYGYSNSIAETYAIENGFTFIELKKPAQPTLKKVSNVNGNVKMTWNAVEGADLYRVYRMVSGGEYEYIGSTTGTSYTDKNAPAGKTCRYRIKAKNEAGYSEYSASIAIKHIDEPTLKSIQNSEYGVLIKWGKVTGAQKYNVYRKVSGGEYKYIGATTKTYYTDKTAKSGKKYYYAIRGKRDDSVSSQSASLSKYYLADPTLNTPSSTSKGIGLRWSKVTGAEGYIIYRKTGSGSYTKLKTEKGVSNVTFRDTTAKKGTKYYYKVKAFYSKTYSEYSNTKSVTDKY